MVCRRMAALLRARRVRYVLSVLAVAWSCSSAAAQTVTNLRAEFRKGQTFVTFDEVQGKGLRYNVYRATSPIVGTRGLAPIAVLLEGSGKNRYTGNNFIITDLGSPLPVGTGLLVWTPENEGAFYYAVTTSASAQIEPGINATTAPVSERVVEVPGAVLLRPAYRQNGPKSNWIRQYFAWEDYRSWDHARWPYYGFRFNVITQPTMVGGQRNPLTLLLHAAGRAGYGEPGETAGPRGIGEGVYVTLVDLSFPYGKTDPYTKTGYQYSFWYGYKKGDGIVINTTERRALRYLHLVMADPEFAVDSNRVYVTGVSLGGGGAMHMAYHFPEVFAAAAPMAGWTDTNAGGLNYNSLRDSTTESGVHWKDWVDQTWLVDHRAALPPLLYTFDKSDRVVNSAAYPNLLTRTEATHNAYFAKWRNEGRHSGFAIGGQLNLLRFKRDEAYPAFADATNSDPFNAPTGQRNVNLDWNSSLHALPGSQTQDAIVDSHTEFGMTFRSLTSDAKVRVTIRNTQQFHLSKGQAVNWSNKSRETGQVLESGTAEADEHGLVTVTITISATGTRLSLNSQSPMPGTEVLSLPGLGFPLAADSTPLDLRLCGSQSPQILVSAG
jgi:dienelactone hydrolase